MYIKKSLCLLIYVSLMMVGSTISVFAHEKIVIAHRGASGYVPEHTIAAKAMAYAMGADYIEQDVVMTKDNQLVVLHDHYLDHVTDVQEKFFTRKREDGRYYVIDFTLDEIRTLNVSERYDMIDGVKVAVFANRFPLNKSIFKVHTLSEEIELIQGLNKSTGKNIGIYPEIKSPSFHLKEGKDLSLAVLQTLKKYGYSTKEDKVFVQTFEIGELKRIHNKLFAEVGIDVNLVQLMGNDAYYDKIITADGLTALSKYADGIGPSLNMIIREDGTKTDLVSNAHKASLKIHPYTLRIEEDQIPKYAKDFEDLLKIFLFEVGVDGVFTDFTDRTKGFLEKFKE
jgi:glycerophosphoryl diester phosphodiesterase